jgi:uncharacterized protein YhdP
MKHLLFSLSRLVIVFLASSIVFFALVVVIAHLLTPYLSRKGPIIEHLASDLLHKPVQISHFSIAWHGLLPVLQGGQVIIWNDSRTQALLQIKELDIGINLFKTLLTGNLRLGKVSGRGLDLVIRQTADKQFILGGVSSLFKQTAGNATQNIQEVLVWLLTEPQLSLQEVNLIYYPASGPKWPDMQLNAILQNEQDHHQLSVQLQFLAEKHASLDLIAEGTGSLGSKWLTTLKARVYLQGHTLLLDRWLPIFGKNYSIEHGVANFKLWTDWQQGHFTRVRILFSNLGDTLLTIAEQAPITFTPFSADVNWESSMNSQWLADAIVQDFNFSAWKKIPGVKGLNAYCHITPLSGKFIAHSGDLELDFTKLFKAPLHFNNWLNELSWQRQGNTTFIQVVKFIASNDDVAVNGQMSFFVPRDKTPEISLLAHVKTERPARIAYYLPQPFIEPALLQWLNSAIAQGLGDGSVVLQGPIAEFPFDKNEGTFLIDTQIKNAELHYEPNWPSVQKINGELIFSGRSMQFLVDSAQIFRTPLKTLQASIPLIKTHVQAVLTITANTINTHLEEVLAFLKATPLAKEMGHQLSGLILSGPLKLALKLDIPLESGKQQFKLAGLGSIEHAQVKIPTHHMQIDNLQGTFSLSEAGIQAQNLLGLLWNKPIVFNIRARPSTQLDINYEGIQTILKPEKNGLRFSVNNKSARGNVFIPNNQQQPIEANFTSILLSPPSTTQKKWNLKQIPKINLNAKDVRYKAIDFGTVQLKLRPLLGGIAIRELQTGNAGYHLIASGAWHTQQNELTGLIGQIDSPNLSDFLRGWGLPANISAEQTHIRFNLQWPGTPYDINVMQLRGNFSFSATNGQIVDIGSSAEAKLSFGRLLTFLSLQSLGRRLQLDFSDFKAKGFDFTTLEGHFSLRNGKAFTRDVSIEGPVAAISITGQVGLDTKNYDLVVRIVPHFTSSLPVIVGLAGGPIAGAITWVANAVLGSTVQSIAATSYHITGSWGEPEIVKTSNSS